MVTARRNCSFWSDRTLRNGNKFYKIINCWCCKRKMENIYNFVIFPFWVLVCLGAWTAQTLLVRQLKKAHYDKWVELGEPMEVHKFFLACITPSSDNPFGGSLKMLLKNYHSMWNLIRYYFKGDIQLDQDEKVRKLRIINLAFMWIAIIFLASLTIANFIVF